MNRLLPIALFAALSGSAWAECPLTVESSCGRAVMFPAAGIKDPSAPTFEGVNGLPPVPPSSGQLRLADKPYAEVLLSMDNAGSITFNWAAIERCAADITRRDADDQTVMNCKIWLAARRDGEARPK